MCRVVNKYKEEYDIYIGRGSLWGNPYVIGPDGPRPEVIEMYKMYIWKKIRSGEVTIQNLLALDGKRLGCFCSPKQCHGDVLVAACNWAKKQ